MTEPKDQSELLAFPVQDRDAVGSKVRTASTNGPGEEVRDTRLYCVLGGRQETEDAQAASADRVRSNTRAISGTMGLARRLSDGCT
jgi:hypothetical protein